MSGGLFDPTVLAGLAQSLAAVMAVLFGWGLSSLTERRSWKRRRIEQIRDRQLTILAQIVLDFRTALEVSYEMTNVVDEIASISARDADEKARSLLQRDAHYRLTDVRNRLSGISAQIESQEMALRLIGYGDAGLVAIRAALVPLLEIADPGRSGQHQRPELEGADLRSQIEQLGLKVTSFLEHGARGLSA